MLTQRLEFNPVDESNFYEVVKLEIRPEQSGFVASNAYSLAECYIYRENNDVFPYAIALDGKAIGFVLLDVDFEEKHATIWRIMIDAMYQGKGLGKRAIIGVIDLIRQSFGFDAIYIDYRLENTCAKHLYESLGFKPIKFNDHGEQVMLLDLEEFSTLDS